VIDKRANLVISKANEVFLKVNAEPHIEYELRDHFTFEVEGAKFMPQYRNRNWNGEIHLFDLRSKRIYVGLLDRVISFCKRHDYTYKFVDNEYYGTPYEENDTISYEGVKDYMTSICNHSPRKYQVEGVYDALKHNRKLLISPTASGKSLMIYALVRYYVDKGKKILLVVPTTSLVEQMYKDFEEYGWDSQSWCHKIYSGKDKTNEFPVTITTWQSVYKLERSFFTDYDVIIGDEAHLFKSKSLVSIMSKLEHAKYRFGFTGTLDGTQTHKWVLEGLFGPSYKVTKTDELMRQGHLSQLDIQCLVLKHDPRKFDTYNDEIEYLISHEKRNNFIKNLTLDLGGNTLILYSRVEAHGQVLYDLINRSKQSDRQVFFVHGGVDAEEREQVREITETENNAIIVASYGTFSTGINIKNLHNVIFASPSKSRIRNLQSIGRVLRKGTNKVKAILYDISDDCTKGSKRNYTLNHFIERIKIYNEENFNYEIITIQLKT
jgi:superfamily II DNA or RNA helicase|tara:strand:+ start:128 stop:1603 length:1476 start_codon:yes stop_codon:yes gene_type:complete